MPLINRSLKHDFSLKNFTDNEAKYKQLVNEYLVLFLQFFYTLNIFISKLKVTKPFKRDEKENGQCWKENEWSGYTNGDTISHP